MNRSDPTLMAEENTSSTDFSESDEDLFEDSQQINQGKRKKSRKSSQSSKKAKPIMSLEDKKEHLSLLDPSDALAVHSYINSYNSDVLVRTFVDMVLEHQTLPILPSQEIIKSWLQHEVKVDVTKDLMKMLINNFMKYFQVKYFNNNVTKATEKDKALFNPKNNFWIPGFQDLPEEALEELHKSKLKYVMEVQNISIKGTLFVVQMLVLRNIDNIMQFIKNSLKIEENGEVKKHLEYILAMAYTTAKMEFPKSYNVKVIDWTTYDSKLLHTKPQWRKDNKEPTSNTTSNLSHNILEKIDNDKIQFQGESISKEEDTFLQKPYVPPKQRKFRKRNNEQSKTKAEDDGSKSQENGKVNNKFPARAIAKGKRRTNVQTTNKPSSSTTASTDAETTPAAPASTQSNKDVISSII